MNPRSIDEINKEYTNVCTEIGDLECNIMRIQERVLELKFQAKQCDQEHKERAAHAKACSTDSETMQ